MKAKHYIGMSGMSGCLPDYSSGACESEQEAIESVVFIFDTFEDTETEALEKALKTEGIYYFENPRDAGADYAEVVECNCDNPQDHGEDI